MLGNKCAQLYDRGTFRSSARKVVMKVDTVRHRETMFHV